MKHLLSSILIAYAAASSAQTWQRTTGPVEDDVHDLCIASNGWIFAMTAFGLNRSTDGGDHWTRPCQFGHGSDTNRVIIAPNGNIVFSSDSGIYVSTNNGETFVQSLKSPTSPNSVRQFSVSGTGRIFAATHLGTVMSDDNGLSWKLSNKGVSQTSVYAVAASHDTVIAFHRNLYFSRSNGDTWTETGMSFSNSGLQLYMYPDGSWVVFSFTDILRNQHPSDSLATGWRSMVDGHLPVSEYFQSYDRMEDGSIFISSLKDLWVMRDFTFVQSVGNGLALSPTFVVKRIAYDKKNDVYYAATSSGGVYKAKLMLDVPKEDVATVDVDVFPNPLTASANIRCSLAEPSPITIQVVDNIGRVRLRTTEFYTDGTHDIPLDVSSLPAGSYLLEVRAGIIRETKLIVVAK
jgi:hypothetical protein